MKSNVGKARGCYHARRYWRNIVAQSVAAAWVKPHWIMSLTVFIIRVLKGISKICVIHIDVRRNVIIIQQIVTIFVILRSLLHIAQKNVLIKAPTAKLQIRRVALASQWRYKHAKRHLSSLQFLLLPLVFLLLQVLVPRRQFFLLYLFLD